MTTPRDGPSVFGSPAGYENGCTGRKHSWCWVFLPACEKRVLVESLFEPADGTLSQVKRFELVRQ